MGLLTFPQVIALLTAAVAARCDLQSFRIPNRLTGPVLGAGLLYHLAVGGTSSCCDSGLGFLFGFGVLLPLHVLGYVGAGDVKLMAALGAWLGLQQTEFVVLFSFLVAGVHAATVLAMAGLLPKMLHSMCPIRGRVSSSGRRSVPVTDSVQSDRRLDLWHQRIPFAPAIAVGVVLNTLAAPWLSLAA